MILINTLVLLLIFLLPLGQLARVSLMPSVNLYAHDAVIVLLILTATPYLLKKHKTISLFKSVGLFVLTALISLAVALVNRPLSQVFIGSLYLWRWLAYFSVFFILIQPNILSRSSQKLAYQSLIIGGYLASVAGLIQYILLPDTRFLFTANWDKHYYRLTGPWLDPGFTGLILVFSLLLVINARPSKLFKTKAVYYLLVCTVFVALMLTYSRSSYLALIGGLAVTAYFRKNWQVIIVGLVAIGFSLLLLPRPGGEGVRLERTQSTIDRFDSSQKILQIIKQRPLVGVGFNLLRFEQHDRGFLNQSWRVSHSGAGADNSILFILATTGIAGLSTYLWLLKQQFNLSLKHKNLSFVSCLTATLVHSQFTNSLFYPWVMVWLWILLALKPAKENS